jgi:cytidylate kinase
MIITAGGKSSSGKSTVMNEIARRLGWKRYSLGEKIKDMAGDIPLHIFYASMDEETERALDEWQKQFGLQHDNFIMDSRLGFKYIPVEKRFNLFFELPLEESARRAFHKKGQTDFATYDEAYNALDKRMKLEQEHYQYLYGHEFKSGKFDHFEKNATFDDGEPFYHYIVDASRPVEEVIESVYTRILQELETRNELHSLQDTDTMYYPESLRLKEEVLFSERTLSGTYYITNERLILEPILGKTIEIPLEYVKEISAQQNDLEKFFNIGRISFMHSNYKTVVPLARRKYVTFSFLREPHELYAKIQQLLHLA